MMNLGEVWRVKTKFDAQQIRRDKLDNRTSIVSEGATFTIIIGPSTTIPSPDMVFFSIDSYHQYRAFEKTIRAHCELSK
jgi:hypothetical protein